MTVLPPEYASFYVGSGKFALCDWPDWPLLRGYWWHLTTDKGDVLYAQTWSTHNCKTRKRITMHGLLIKTPDGMVIDHINGNGLDNRRSNLRIVTFAQNTWNRRARKTSKSRFKGVHWDKKDNSWRSTINVSGKRHYLGRFKREEDAAHAYATASKKLHGEFGLGDRDE